VELQQSQQLWQLRQHSVWSIDFQFNVTLSGKAVKILTIVNEHAIECLGGLIDYSITALDLADQLGAP
jgi:hypothetical protein